MMAATPCMDGHTFQGQAGSRHETCVLCHSYWFEHRCTYITAEGARCIEQITHLGNHVPGTSTRETASSVCKVEDTEGNRCRLEQGHQGMHDFGHDFGPGQCQVGLPDTRTPEEDPIQNMIFRATHYTREALQSGDEPLLSRASVLAQLWQAEHLKRIADRMERPNWLVRLFRLFGKWFR